MGQNAFGGRWVNDGVMYLIGESHEFESHRSIFFFSN